MPDCQEPEYEELEVKGETESAWVEMPGRAIVDASAFVLFRKAKRWLDRDPDPHGRSFETVWIIEAFPGPNGQFVALAEFGDELRANIALAKLSKTLTA